MIRVILYIVFLHSFLFCSGQNSSLIDGPYLFYKNDSLFIESINNGKLKKDSIDLKLEATPLLSVAVPGKPGVSFPVPLKEALNYEPAEYKSAEKLFVVSDIEGTFQGFNKLLLAGGVINEQFKWTFGKGHLVVCGDLFDRGEEVTACLWLLYKLESDAKAKGGYVHVILGNHEIMNLSEDLRYVHPKYSEVAMLMGRTYMDLYAANTELGRWLRTKNIMERIGNYLFMHGGVSQAVNETGLSLKEINHLVRPLYDKDGFDSLLLEKKATLFFNGNTSPFWYRGYFVPPLASMAQVDSTLNIFDVKRIVVGHTIVDSIQTRYHGKIIAIDVNHHTGNHQALLIEKDSFYRMNVGGKKTKLH
jgi:hypothetical protein